MARLAQEHRNRIWYWLAEVAVLYIFWLLCVDTTAASEMSVGAGAAVLAATGAEIVRGLDFARFHPRSEWLLQLWRIPGMLASGCWVLIKVLFLRGILRRDITGELKTVPRAAPLNRGCRSVRRHVRTCHAVAGSARLRAPVSITQTARPSSGSPA